MTGYVEVLQVIGATIIFSLILTTTNRYMLSHTQRQVGIDNHSASYSERVLAVNTAHAATDLAVDRLRE